MAQHETEPIKGVKKVYVSIDTSTNITNLSELYPITYFHVLRAHLRQKNNHADTQTKSTETLLPLLLRDFTCIEEKPSPVAPVQPQPVPQEEMPITPKVNSLKMPRKGIATLTGAILCSFSLGLATKPVPQVQPYGYQSQNEVNTAFIASQAQSMPSLASKKDNAILVVKTSKSRLNR